MTLQILPTSCQDFVQMRKDNMVYVDKTQLLVNLVHYNRAVFLSRPRRFGKSLTLSTIQAMFEGKAELFEGLAAQKWVQEQSKKPSPVIYLDMSSVYTTSSEILETTLRENLYLIAKNFDLKLELESSSGRFQELIQFLYTKMGPVAVLVDEYDAPILEWIDNPEKSNEMLRAIRSFYITLKSSQKYLRFVMVTGVTKFSKAGLFSGLNNLNDISSDEEYGNLCGYTQEELESCFSDRIDTMAEKLSISREELLQKLKDCYDGFSFDGVHKVYAPWSVLSALEHNDFKNYWYNSGSPSFLVKYLKKHAISSPEIFRNSEIDINSEDSFDVENIVPESLLHQAGYLTIVGQEENSYILDYPNKEILKSISKLYMERIYSVPKTTRLCDQLNMGLRGHDIAQVIKAFNQILVSIPYCDLFKDALEGSYRSIFLVALNVTGVIRCDAELYNALGRSDLVVEVEDRFWVFEFKMADEEEQIPKRLEDGIEQIISRKYAAPFENKGKEISKVAIVINKKTRHIGGWKEF